MQAVPGLDAHGAVALFDEGELGVGGGPGRGVRQGEAGAVAARTAAGARRRRLGVGMEVAADPDQRLGPGAGQPGAEGDGVVAGVEDEQRDGLVLGQEPHEAFHLVDGGRGGVLAGGDAPGVEGGGPAVGRPVELGDPLIGPAGDDGLAGGVAGRRVVEAPLRAGLGVAAVPGRGVHREHQRPAGGPALDEELAEPLGLDPPAGQRLVQAAVGTAEHRLQAERGRRAQRPGRCSATSCARLCPSWLRSPASPTPP